MKWSLVFAQMLIDDDDDDDILWMYSFDLKETNIRHLTINTVPSYKHWAKRQSGEFPWERLCPTWTKCFSCLPVFYCSFPHLSFLLLSPPVPHPFIICLYIVFVLPQFVHLCHYTVFPPKVISSFSSCLSWVCFWFLFLLFLIDFVLCFCCALF